MRVLQLNVPLAFRYPLLKPGARLGVPPVVGAALLGLDRLAAPPSAGDRLRTELTEARLAPTA